MLARFLMAAALAAAIAGCSDAADESADDERPSAPVADDPAYLVQSNRSWLLIGNDLTPGHNTLSLTVVAPAGVERVAAWLAAGPAVPATRDGDQFTVQVDVSAVEAGEHQLLLAADGGEVAFASVPFVRTHPFYVVTTIDWDFADIADDELRWQEQLHAMFPELRLTHLVGPYTFTDPMVSAARAGELGAWLLGMRDTHADEIGLHIHPYCSFVESAGLGCRHTPSVLSTAPDTSGYAVQCSAYPQAEFEQLLRHADQLFQQNGLGKPTSFRAGAWTANDEVLRALAATGYVADTSALNWQRIEEWTTPQVAGARQRCARRLCERCRDERHLRGQLARWRAGGTQGFLGGFPQPHAAVRTSPHGGRACARLGVQRRGQHGPGGVHHTERDGPRVDARLSAMLRD
jgi:hypothetical protein